MKTKNPFIQILSNFRNFELEEEKLITKHLELNNYSTRDTFLKTGERNDQLGLITSGVFRYYFYDENGSEITAHFMDVNEFVGNVACFFEYSISAGTIEALTDCEVIQISKSNWDICKNEIKDWEVIFQKIINNVLIKKTNFQRSLLNNTATESYLKFLNYYPELSNKVPLQHVASYLGMTPFSLSRVRKTISTL